MEEGFRHGDFIRPAAVIIDDAIRAEPAVEMEGADIELHIGSDGCSRKRHRDLMILQPVHVKQFYEQIEFLLDEICDDDAGLIQPEHRKYFEHLHSRVIRLAAESENLKEYLVQVRDSYQSQMAIEQNDVMKVFTMPEAGRRADCALSAGSGRIIAFS